MKPTNEILNCAKQKIKLKSKEYHQLGRQITLSPKQVARHYKTKNIRKLINCFSSDYKQKIQIETPKSAHEIELALTFESSTD